MDRSRIRSLVRGIGWLAVAFLALAAIAAALSIGMPVDPQSGIDPLLVAVVIVAGSAGFLLFRWLESGT
jgi:hypothetical protein